MITPLAQLVAACAAGGCTYHRPEDGPVVALTLETVTRDGYEAFARPDRLVAQLCAAPTITTVDPAVVGRFLAGPHITMELVQTVMSRQQWEPEKLRDAVDTIVETRAPAAFAALTSAQLPREYRLRVLARLRSTRRAALKRHLSTFTVTTSLPGWLADATIDLVPARALRYWVRASGDADAVARRLLSLTEPDVFLIHAAATRHKFSAVHARRLVRRLDTAKTRSTVEAARALLEVTDGTARERVAHDLRAPAPRYAAQRPATAAVSDYLEVLGDVERGETVGTFEQMRALFDRLSADKLADPDRIRRACQAWECSLSVPELVELAKSNRVAAGRVLGDGELVRRAREEDQDALNYLASVSHSVFRDDAGMLGLARRLVPIPVMRGSGDAVVATLCNQELRKLYEDGGLAVADVFARLFGTFSGTVAELTDVARTVGLGSRDPGSPGTGPVQDLTRPVAAAADVSTDRETSST